MKGLQGKNEFRREYTAAQMETLERLAEIEQEDEDRCAGCGGEDRNRLAQKNYYKEVTE